MKIYFDNAATTMPLAVDVPEIFGNPSSPHGLGIAAERALNSARRDIAEILSCRPAEIIFTSGGTESNNLALLGCARRTAITGGTSTKPGVLSKPGGLVACAAPWEHPSVLAPLKFAEEMGLVQTVISPEFSPDAALVSLSQISHETGDLFDVSQIAAELKRANSKILIHVDGAQGFCKERINLANIDMYSFSGHKIHGAAGVGGLFVRSGVRLVPLIHGGGQENGMRAGTENLHGILQTAQAATFLHASLDENQRQVIAIKTELAKLQHDLPNVLENAMGETSPYILNMSFLGIKGETLVHLLSEKGIYASMGAACRSRKKQKSALETMGFTKQRAESAVRFSFSHTNTLEEAITAREIIKNSVIQLRKILN